MIVFRGDNDETVEVIDLVAPLGEVITHIGVTCGGEIVVGEIDELKGGIGALDSLCVNQLPNRGPKAIWARAADDDSDSGSHEKKSHISCRGGALLLVVGWGCTQGVVIAHVHDCHDGG